MTDEEISKLAVQVAGILRVEKKEMELKELVIEIAKRKEVESKIEEMKEDFIEKFLENIELDDTQKEIIELRKNDNGFSIKLYDKPINFKVTSNLESLKPKGGYENKGIWDYNKIYDFYIEKVFPKLYFRFEYSYENFFEKDINKLLKSTIEKTLKLKEDTK